MPAKKKITKKTATVKTVKSEKTESKVKAVSPVKKLSDTLSARPQIKIYALLVVIAALLLTGLYFLKGYVIAATVNGKPISRLAVIRELEKQGGTEVLDNMINMALIKQEADKNNITVSQSEIDTEIKNIEDSLNKQGTTLDDALAQRGQTRTELIEQIRTQKLVEKMLSDKIQVTDAEAQKYFNDNKTVFGKDAKFADVKNDIINQLKSQKLSTEYSKWISDVKAKAKISYFASF